MQDIDLSPFKDKKVALVLSGGVIKAGAWHLGVALALEEMGFSFKSNGAPKDSYQISTYVGSSAGALINLYFAMGHKPLDIIDANLNRKKTKLVPISYRDMLYLKNPMKKPTRASSYDPFIGLPYAIKKLLQPLTNISGFFSTYGLHNYIQTHLNEFSLFDELESDLFVVATQLDHSRKVIFSKYNYPNPSHDSTAIYYTDISIADSIAASMSVPPFYSPYPIKNPLTAEVDYYLDGEIRETLSTHVALDNNCNHIICSWTHTPLHYHDEIGSLINYGIPAIGIQAIYLMIQKKIIANRAKFSTAKDAIDSVYQYMMANDFSVDHQKKILNILERKLHYKKDVHLIDIYPDHDNYKVFFHNFFSLDPNNTAEVVKAGYQKTVKVLKEYQW
ncbi:MAG: patatin-like phospholipase family protein [Bdellovibrionales bacterium]|jgi:predicted acylesterase/phospholipase RssA|nr:patatin-like phospholipase family protein [Bdellovibrionales bacterium]MBT3525523.1 patatin-like phospholipase family protein [Bdellovibrionales bacterium]MBT7668213.1 patatin-like phospholipase family protein [Bdellovibrionales bacterium]MBT7766047.1 patatin-like phospholipase family protein [Bdellovibrionales bacterium]